MFDRLAATAAHRTATEAAGAFVSEQQSVLDAMNQGARDALTQEIRAQNLAAVDELIELGEELDMPGLVADLNTKTGAEIPEMRCLPVSWMPHPEATIDANYGVADGVKALRGWAIRPENHGAHRLGLLVTLYHTKVEDTFPGVQVSVSPLFQHDQDPTLPKVSTQELLTRDSSAAYEYLRLREVSDTLLNAGEPSDEKFLRAYYQAVRLLADNFTDDSFTRYMASLWDLGKPDGTPYKYREPRNILTLAQHVVAAHNVLDTVSAKDFTDANVLTPDQLSTHLLALNQKVFESFASLPQIEALFAPASTVEQPKGRRSSKTVKTVVPAGPIAANARSVVSREHLTATHFLIADQIDAFYSDGQA